MSGTRTARALIVAGTKGDAPPTPHFVTGVSEIAGFLPGHGFKTLLARVETNLSRAEFTAALDALAAASASGDLAVIMFGGHGDNGDLVDRQEGWVFRDEVLTDTELAQALSAFGAGVEKVVISDCCYAAGMFTPDNTPLSFVQARISRMVRALEQAGLNAAADFVIIASAAEDEITAVSLAANDFAVAVRTETATSTTYLELGEALRIMSANKSSRWSVDGRPLTALEKTPLATS